ncbi:MAG: diguanylate cyclase, partial [Henriciella sp.]|nr:diguanylate cyclase [Henriciella sp.]
MDNNRERLWRPELKIATAGLAIFVITSLTIAWSRFGGGLALVWPGSAIMAALLVVLPKDRWIASILFFAILSSIATALFGFGPKVAAPLALVNVFEGFIIAWLLSWLRPSGDWLESVSGLERMIMGIVVGTCLASLPGGLLAAWIAAGAWQSHVFDWFTSHALGSLLCFPLALLIMTGVMREKIRRESSLVVLECAGHCIVIACVSWISYFQTTLALLFLPILPLMYAAWRCGRIGATVGLLTIATLAAVSLQAEVGFFNHVELSLASEVQFLQFYLTVLLLLALPISVALKQHRLVLGELEEKRALERLVADNTDDALLNLDASGKVRYCSAAAQRLCGKSDPTGAGLAEFFDPLDEQLVNLTLLKAAGNPGVTRTLELAVVNHDDVVWLETKLCAVPLKDGRAMAGYAVTIRDITARKHAELNAVREAETDALTGLPNRRAFMRHAEPRLAGAARRSVGVAIIDLDHFKIIIDPHGHPAGDTALCEVARVMRRLSRPGLFFARLGGEEFGLIIEQASLADMIAASEEVRRAISALNPVTRDGIRFDLSASVGMARLTTPMSATADLR